jgi:predicted SprT family Zn-dependent metalloprotease
MEIEDAVKDINKNRKGFKLDILKSFFGAPRRKTFVVKSFCKKCQTEISNNTTILTLKKTGEFVIQCKKCKAKLDTGAIMLEKEPDNTEMYR